MPRLPTIRVIGSHAISTTPLPAAPVAAGRSAALVIGVCLLELFVRRVMRGLASHRQVGLKPVLSCRPRVRHLGSLSTVLSVVARKALMTFPYKPLAAVETLLPGGSSMNGMNLSGKPGIVQAIQIPPTFG